MAPRYRWDDFTLDLDTYRLERGGVSLPLEPKAFNLLALMIRKPGHLFSKQEIFEAVWPATAVTDHALTRVVAQLRRVLKDDVRGARYLETVPTRGYRWICQVEEVSPVLAPAVPEAPPARPSRRAFSGLASVLLILTAVLASGVWIQKTARTSAAPAEDSAGAVVTGPSQWPVQVTTHRGLDQNPALSPQGDAIAFVSDRTGAREIYVRVLGQTGTELPLTSDGGQNVQPAWSPDGKQLAYHSDRSGGIWIIPSRGGTARQVAPAGSSPAWSPDGTRIAFQSDEDTDVNPSGFGAQSGSTIWVVDAGGGNLHALTEGGHPAGGHASPSWSRNGRYLAFSVFDAGTGNGVWVLTLDSHETRLLAGGGGLFESVFSPDDSSVYVAGGEALIVRIPFDGQTGRARGEREVFPIAGVPGVRGLSISPDGRRLAFGGLALSSQIWAQRVQNDGSAIGVPHALASDTSRRNSLPAVSPDGSKVAYMSTRRGELSNIWVMDVDGRSGVQLTPDETAEHTPKWFPDGRRVAYTSTRGASRGIWSVDVALRREALLFDISSVRPSPGLIGRLAELDMAPSMRQAVFSLIEPTAGRRVTYVSGVAPFEPRALTNATQSIGYPAWSPDERRVAVEIKEGSSTQAGVIDLQTGVLRRLTNDRGQAWVRSWSPDGRRMAVAMLRAGVWSLRWLDADSGREGPITLPGQPREFVRYPAWSPRGDLVVYERGEMTGNIWLLPLKPYR